MFVLYNVMLCCDVMVSVAVSQCCSVTVSQYHSAAVSQCCSVTVLQCHSAQIPCFSSSQVSQEVLSLCSEEQAGLGFTEIKSGSWETFYKDCNNNKQ